MNKSSKVVILSLAILWSKVTNVAAQTQQQVTTKLARAETQLSKTVVFISVEIKPPNQAASPTESRSRAAASSPQTITGTGFLVSVRDNRLGNGKGFGYLVTNRHVAEAIEQDDNGNCVKHEVQQAYVTMNLREPVNGSRSEKRPLFPPGHVHWYFPNNEAVDLAVVPFGISDKYDALPLLSTDFLTSEVLEGRNVVPGDRVLTVGFFYAYGGVRQIQPILREGVLAMLPDGPMSTTTCKSGNVYLADVHITRGNSGSPIFIVPALGLGAGEALGGVPSVFGLLGVVSGYMQETSDLTLRASTTWHAALQANSGVSVVVPAEQLKALLESPELQRLRDEIAGHLGTH